jgi:hypothetical protein
MAAAQTAGAKATTALAPQGLGSAAKACLGAKAAVTSGVAAKVAAVPAAAALGWGVALGTLGPWLAVGSLGLAVTGVYFYVQARRLVDEEPDFGV